MSQLQYKPEHVTKYDQISTLELMRLTVHGEIVHLRLNYLVCRDWLKTGHVIRSLEFDWTIPQPILSSPGQLFRRIL